MEDVWVRIPVVICREAQKLGVQYTKRFLPDFLIPHARMRLDRVIEAARAKEQGAGLERCNQILGCLDVATLREHVKRIEKAAAETALLFAEKQAATPHLDDSNQEPRPLPVLDRLEELYLKEQQARIRSGRGRIELRSLRYFLQTALWKNGEKDSMSFHSRPPPKPW